MRRVAIVAAAVAVTAVVGVIGFVFWTGPAVRDPSMAMPNQVVDPEIVTGAIAPRQTLQPTPHIQSASTVEDLSPKIAMPGTAAAPCVGPHTLGVSRVVEIDSTDGPGFGFEQFRTYDFLEAKEIVLTFDDGPWPNNTPAVLSALAAQCTKALFFPIGKHVMWRPDILKQVAEAGHTIGSHTWSHANLSKLSTDLAKDEIEKGISAVRAVLGHAAAPFFRFPGLRQPQEMVRYLQQRNIGIFSIDVDSSDFRIRNPEQLIASVMAKLEKRGKGILLLHDFQHSTALALPQLLLQLKGKGYKIVHVRSRAPVETLATYDSTVKKASGGPSASAQPLAKVVKTVVGN